MSHFFEFKSFSDQQEQILRSSAGPTEYLENFLSDEEFLFCRNLVCSVKKWPEIGEVSKYWGFGSDHFIGKKLQWLLDKVQKTIPNLALDFFAIQEAIEPWKIHADIRYKSQDVPYKVILFPMDVEPVAGPISVDQWPETYTINFHQKNFLHNAEILIDNGQTGIYGNGSQDQWEPPILDPLTEGIVPGYHIDKEQWQKYFSHLPYEHLEGLTIDTINQWKPRSMIYWDNTTLHCSDNFLSNNIRTKKSLMIFSHYLQ